jgi:homoaconitase/3-isopropylmalate dehydratase large subunit
MRSSVLVHLEHGTTWSSRLRCCEAGASHRIFIEAGAVMLPAGCGPCNEGVVGPLDGGEVSISTATANLPGKFGNKDAKLYLGSPATVAASAIAGKIVDARVTGG